MSLLSTTPIISNKDGFNVDYVWSFKGKCFGEHFASKKAFNTIQSPLFGHARDEAKFYLSLTYYNECEAYHRAGSSDKLSSSQEYLMVFFNVSPLERRNMSFSAKISFDYRDEDGYSHSKKIRGYSDSLCGSVNHDWVCWKWLTAKVDFCELKYTYAIGCSVTYGFDYEDSNFMSIPRQNFSTFYRNASMADVSLYVSKANSCSTKFQAHKLVLSAQSPFFRNKFLRLCVNRYDFVDCSVEVVEIWLEFVYTQRIDNFAVLKANTEKLMHFAEEYEMPLLANYIEDQLAVNVAVDNAITSLCFALSNKLPVLKKFTLQFIYEHLPLVMQTTAWIEHIRNRHDFALINELLDNLNGFSVQLYTLYEFPQEGPSFEEGKFEDLRSDGLVDSKLRVNGNDFPVHKAMLTAQSSKFATLFENMQQNSTQNTIEITDYSEAAVKTMLDFIYFQPIPFATIEPVSEELLDFAQKYRMPSLRRHIIEQYFLNRSTTNFLKFIRFAHRNKLKHLESHMLFIFWDRMWQIRSTKEWKQSVVKGKDIALIELLLSIFPTVVQCKCNNPDGAGWLKIKQVK